MTPTHQLHVRVYYEDTDFSGVVYHASYLRFLERGRTELLRARGVHQAAIFSGALGPPFGFAVRRMSVDFLRPARMDDLLVVETVPESVGGASVTLAQRILREDEPLLTATVQVACVSDGRPARLPAWVRERL